MLKPTHKISSEVFDNTPSNILNSLFRKEKDKQQSKLNYPISPSKMKIKQSVPLVLLIPMQIIKEPILLIYRIQV